MKKGKKKPSKKDIEQLSEGIAQKVCKADQSGEQQYDLTPKGALWISVIDFYKNDDMETLDKFQRRVVQDMSLIATGGKSDKLFGDGINSLMFFVKNAMTMAGDMYETLAENGIDFDLEKYGMQFKDGDEPQDGDQKDESDDK